MSVVLDAGALIAVERLDREMIAVLKRERLAGTAPRTHGGVVGQVWRGGHGRQAMLAKFLDATEVVPVDATLGRVAGELMGRSRSTDVIDAALVCITRDGDDLFTSDPADLKALARAAGVHVELISI
jgi:hypothetical protein